MDPNQETYPSRRLHPRLIGLIVVIIAVIAGWVTFDYSYCGALRCAYGSAQTTPTATSTIATSTPSLPAQPNQPPTELVQSSSPTQPGNEPPTQLHIGNAVITVEYATTTAEEELGLSKRASLAPLAGMLFVVNPPAPQGMWMINMNFSLDMVWFDEDMHIIYIAKDVTPQSYPEVFAPTQPASYVLEVNAGFVDAHDVSVGQTASLTY